MHLAIIKHSTADVTFPDEELVIPSGLGVKCRVCIDTENIMVWKPRAVVASVIEERGRFLMVEEQVDGRRVLNQPAGHLEYGESLIAAVRRETREETGLVFEPEALLGIMQLDSPDPDRVYLRFVFTGSHHRPAQPAPLDPDILALHWLSADEICRHPQLTPRSALVLAAIRLYQEGVRHPLELLHWVA